VAFVLMLKAELEDDSLIRLWLRRVDAYFGVQALRVLRRFCVRG